MKRFILVFLFAGIILFSSYCYGIQNLLDDLCINSSGEYTYVDSGDATINQLHINKGKLGLFSFGQYVYINKDQFDISQFIKDNNIEIISVDELFNEATTLYVLFCKCLPKFRTVNNKKYNLQIAITKEYVKMGYPAIFDSF